MKKTDLKKDLKQWKTIIRHPMKRG